jgi:hypothetical protein
MNRRLLFFFRILSVVVAVSVCLVPFVDAQSVSTDESGDQPWTSSTPWGDPDLQGVWASDSATPMERPRALAGREFLSDEEVVLLQRRAAELFAGETDAAFGDSVYQAVLNEAETFVSTDTTGNYNQFWLTDRWFENRTSLIVDPADGRIPPLTLEAQARQEALRTERNSDAGESQLPGGPEDFNAGLRCTGGRVPMTGRGYNSNYQIVQAPGYVVINMEMMHDARIIPLDGRPHGSSNIRTYVGDSRGHWEGNTLVVETTNLKSGGRTISASTGENLRLIERFSRVNANSLRYEFTVDDPDTWTEPWTAAIFMRPAPGTGLMYEFACHEGNYAIGNSLRGARANETGTQNDSN